VLQALGDLAGAKACYERALAIAEQIYGPQHPVVATMVNNLGGVLRDLGDLAGAKDCLERALAILKKNLPENHPKIKFIMNNLARL
jgi:tetratricopeptide (TPR) repeat protein